MRMYATYKKRKITSRALFVTHLQEKRGRGMYAAGCAAFRILLLFCSLLI